MAEQPSLARAISLQGRNTIAEQLGRMQFQAGQREADRAAKRGIEEAKRIAEIEQKFAIPKGQYHRLVLPEIAKTQAKYLNQVKTLKAERPNNWQNDIQNLSNSYIGEMEKLETLSKDLSDYDNKTATIDRGNTYFSNEWKKYNSAFETAKDLDDFKAKLDASGFDPSKATDFVVRPNGSISYTPFSNQKPLETIMAQVQKVPTIEYKEVKKPGDFGSIVTENVKKRPATIAEAQEILKNNPQYKDINEIQTIEDVVDTYLATNPYGVRQYADQNNLNLRMNPDGTTNMEDLATIKQDLMSRVGKFTQPGISERVAFAPRGGTVVNVSAGEPVDQAIGQPDFNDGQFKSAPTADPSYKGGQYTFTFGKELSQAFSPNQVFDRDFKDAGPTSGGTLPNVKPDGVFILYTDDKGAPINLKRDNPDKIKKAGVFVRLKSGTNQFYYIKEENFRNLDAQVALKPTAVNQFKKYIEAMRANAVNVKSKPENISNVKNSLKD